MSKHKVEHETIVHTLCAIQCTCGKGFFGTDARQARDKFAEHIGQRRSTPSSPKIKRDHAGRALVSA